MICGINMLDSSRRQAMLCGLPLRHGAWRRRFADVERNCTKCSDEILYHIKNQKDATLAVLFNSHCKITLHVSDAFCAHHQEYSQL